MDALLAEIRACRVCEAHLPLGPRPVVQASASARLLIVGQAPSMTVHRTGVPWDDKSGEQLRRWLGIDRDVFYDATRIAIMPMGYCYPGVVPAATCRRARSAPSSGTNGCSRRCRASN